MKAMSSSDRATPPAGTLDLQADAIVRRGLRDHVYDSILGMLLRGSRTSGERLSIDTIARQLGVSPTPVREALVDLERTGLVTREALKGYRVAPPLNRQQLDELFVARAMLETTAVRLASANAQQLLPELREAQERHRVAGEEVIASAARGERDTALSTEYFARDQDFHQVILNHAGNRYLLEMSANLGALLHRQRRAVHRGVTDVREAIAEHAAIVVAFEADDADLAVQAMQTHIDLVRIRTLTEEG